MLVVEVVVMALSSRGGSSIWSGSYRLNYMPGNRPDGSPHSNVALDPMRKSALAEPSNEVKIEAGQRRADLIHRSAAGKGPEVDGHEAKAIDQIDHDLLGLAIIS
jgi:hypothetical protein